VADELGGLYLGRGGESEGEHEDGSHRGPGVKREETLG
jgi:hypothetical protein